MLCGLFTAQADELVSGGTYRILTTDGQYAISSKDGTIGNNATVTMLASDTDNDSQYWVITKNGDYWQVKSASGNYCVDNPVNNAATFENQLCLWQTSGGDNQKWTFKEGDNGNYYMVPFANADKCYARDVNGKLTLQDQSSTTQVKLEKVEKRIDKTTGFEIGGTYRICSTDGLYAITNNGTAKNNVVVKTATVSDEDDGQFWVLTKNGDYWQIKSALGEFCIDNPSARHTNFSNQLCLWQTSGGDNQKWTFKAGDDGNFYMVPFEDATKCYAFNASGTFTFQAQNGAATQVKVVKAQMPSPAIAKVNGYYAIQAVSTYPSYNYASEGKFLSFSAAGTPSLTSDYTYGKSRLLITTDDKGVATITLPQAGLYAYANGTTFNGAKTTNTDNVTNNHFVFYMNTNDFTLDTQVAIHTESNTEATKAGSINLLSATAAGTSVSISSKALNQGYTFRLIALPAAEDVDQLQSIIAAAKDYLATITGEEATVLSAAIAEAQSELDYAYVTKKDIVKDVAALKKLITDGAAESGRFDNAVTSINEVSGSAVSVKAVNHRIVVTGASTYTIYSADGKVQAKDGHFASGSYIVVADGQTFKVAL